MLKLLPQTVIYPPVETKEELFKLDKSGLVNGACVCCFESVEMYVFDLDNSEWISMADYYSDDLSGHLEKDGHEGMVYNGYSGWKFL